jgi:hypothetical protein
MELIFKEAPMRKLICLGALTLLLGLATLAQAVTVYLKDGGTIDAERVWRDKSTVYVLVNKEDLVELAPQEVELKKTFGKKAPKAQRAKKQHRRPPVAEEQPHRQLSPPTAEPGPAPEGQAGTIKGHKKEMQESLEK